MATVKSHYFSYYAEKQQELTSQEVCELGANIRD